MDPITAALRVLEKTLDIVKLAMEGQPPDVRAELWRRHLEVLQKGDRFWENVARFFDRIVPDGKKEAPAMDSEERTD